LEYWEVKPRTEYRVLAAVPHSEPFIQLHFSMGSAMVSTLYTCVVLGQEAIEARGIESRNLCQLTLVWSKLVNDLWHVIITTVLFLLKC